MYYSICRQIFNLNGVRARQTLNTLFYILDKRSTKNIWLLSLFIVFFLACFSTLFGNLIFLEPFYIIPITLASWYGSKRSGFYLAVVSVLLLLLIKEFQTEFDPRKILSYGLPCLISFVLLAILVTNFRSVYRVESVAADTDSLTNINNSRGFYVELANELLRSSRYEHVFSLAYLDIDNFKFINDSLGHATGDKLLVEVANCLKSSLRKTDIVARLGGDEFACLLPETEQLEAKAAFFKASELLRKRMKICDWPVSFSVGLVTFDTMPVDIKETMKIADELMYSVKNKKKNNISYQVWHGKT